MNEKEDGTANAVYRLVDELDRRLHVHAMDRLREEQLASPVPPNEPPAKTVATIVVEGEPTPEKIADVERVFLSTLAEGAIGTDPEVKPLPTNWRNFIEQSMADTGLLGEIPQKDYEKEKRRNRVMGWPDLPERITAVTLDSSPEPSEVGHYVRLELLSPELRAKVELAMAERWAKEDGLP